MLSTTQLLHDTIWQKELEMLSAFTSCIPNYMPYPENLVQVLLSVREFRELFLCQLKTRFTLRCKYQIQYLHLLSACLDVPYFSQILRRLGVHETYIRPFMSHVVAENFGRDKSMEHWSIISKLAFKIVHRVMAVYDIDGSFEIDLNKIGDQMKLELGEMWDANYIHYMSELRVCCNRFDLIEESTYNAYIDEDSYEDSCNQCISFDFDAVEKRRRKRVNIMFKLPCRFEHQSIRRLLPFLLNVCTPPIEDTPMWILDLLARNDLLVGNQLSRKLLHQKHIIMAWSICFLSHDRRTHGSRPWSDVLSVAQSLLGLPITERPFYEQDHPDWQQFNQRTIWFVESFKEMFVDNPKVGILRFFEYSSPIDPFNDMQAAAFFLALVRIHDGLSEEEHLEVIQTIADHLCATDNQDDDDVRSVITLYHLLLSKRICNELVCSLLGEELSWIEDTWWDLDTMELAAFRFLKDDTPEWLLRTSIMVIEMSQQYNPPEKTSIRAKALQMMHNLVLRNYQADILTTAIARIEAKARIHKKRKRPRMEIEEKSRSVSRRAFIGPGGAVASSETSGSGSGATGSGLGGSGGASGSGPSTSKSGGGEFSGAGGSGFSGSIAGGASGSGPSTSKTGGGEFSGAGGSGFSGSKTGGAGGSGASSSSKSGGGEPSGAGGSDVSGTKTGGGGTSGAGGSGASGSKTGGAGGSGPSTSKTGGGEPSSAGGSDVSGTNTGGAGGSGASSSSSKSGGGEPSGAGGSDVSGTKTGGGGTSGAGGSGAGSSQKK